MVADVDRSNGSSHTRPKIFDAVRSVSTDLRAAKDKSNNGVIPGLLGGHLVELLRPIDRGMFGRARAASFIKENILEVRFVDDICQEKIEHQERID